MPATIKTLQEVVSSSSFNAEAGINRYKLTGRIDDLPRVELKDLTKGEGSRNGRTWEYYFAYVDKKGNIIKEKTASTHRTVYYQGSTDEMPSTLAFWERQTQVGDRRGETTLCFAAEDAVPVAAPVKIADDDE